MLLPLPLAFVTVSLLLATPASGSYPALPYLALIAFLAGIVTTVWSMVGTWRSAGKHVARGGRLFWAIAARSALALSLLHNLVNVIAAGG
jgi:hypothetical protein